MTSENKISRRDALKAMVAAAAATVIPSSFSALAGPVGPSAAASSRAAASYKSHGLKRKRPNVLWIVVEGVPLSVLSCYGSRINRTPNIDRIAQEGLMFHNAFCTNALCAPSRSTLLTGKYSNLTKMIANPGVTPTGRQWQSHFEEGQETFVRIMKEHGYQTALAGKWHLPTEVEELKVPKGSPNYVDRLRYIGNPGSVGFDSFLFKRGAGSNYYNIDYLENATLGSRITKARKIQGYVTDVITDYTIDTMKRMASSGRPFLMFYSPFNDHIPFQPPHRFKDLYRNVSFPEPNTFWDDYSHRSTAALMSHQRIEFMSEAINWGVPSTLPNRDRKEANYQVFVRRFLATLHALDDNVGKLLGYLDQSGLADNTVVMFTSDHGFFMGDHGWYDKRFMYEQALRVPWMVRWPSQIKAGTETNAWNINIDNAPTTLDMLGIPVPDEMQGRSLLPLFDGTTPKGWRRDLYYHYYEFGKPFWVYPMYGVRTEHYKLINYYRQNEWELFDLDKDPDEMYSLMEWGGYKIQPGYEKIAYDLVGRLKALRKRYRDDTGWPVKFWPTSDYDK